MLIPAGIAFPIYGVFVSVLFLADFFELLALEGIHYWAIALTTLIWAIVLRCA